MRRSILRALAIAALAVGGQVQAQPHLVRHWSQAPGDETVTFQGKTFVNHGLVAVGRLDGAARDFKGDTLGSFSGMALRSWRRLPDGTYEGELLTLPDRGPNGVGSVAGTVDYANRLHAHHLTLEGGIVPNLHLQCIKKQMESYNFHHP
jgi:hypothetical protein